jgi:hypothetical protein
MPQFDFYTWSAISFWTIFFFQYFYFFLLYYVLSALSEIQKTLQKVKFFLKKKKSTTLVDFFCNLYLTKKKNA